jgi:hypothetical protein
MQIRWNLHWRPFRIDDPQLQLNAATDQRRRFGSKATGCGCLECKDPGVAAYAGKSCCGSLEKVKRNYG